MWMQECVTCASSKNGGLQIWMRHLTEDHVLPSEWPSDRAARLTGPAALKPYTTITESKKKRRKDSIPRPLNSFMLFAQHIRRNVLRVFSDASNSAISQQLGDLWRTVPLRLRNQYDEEANRLVKIHQLEFPNYKYQPKKRVQQHTSATVSGSTSSAAVASVSCGVGGVTSSCTTTGIVLSSSSGAVQQRELDCARSLIRTQSRDADSVAADSFAVRPRMHGITSSNSGITYTNDPSAKQSFDSTMRVISPQKCSIKALYTRVDSKRSASNVSTAGGLYKSSSNSLSSVLPPLLTPSLSCPATSYSSRAGSISSSSTDSFHAGSYDSAYASGINSSSSSSASSPAVGDLLSPAKSLVGIPQTVCSKSSPVRRKIQLIPMRPQSQQLPPAHGYQTTRQRFLSANSNTTGPSSPSSLASPLIDSPTNSELVYFMSSSNHQPSLVGFGSIDEVDSGLHPVTTTMLQQHQQQILSPVFFKLETDGATNSGEELILALPPGTTIIQTIQSNPEQQVQSTTGSRRIYLTSCGKSTPTSGVIPTSRVPIQLMQPVKFMNVIGRTARGETAEMLPNHDTAPNHSTFEDLSPPPYSSNSSCSSVLSPLSNDIFPHHHHHHSQQHHHSSDESHVQHPGSLDEVDGDVTGCVAREPIFMVKSENEIIPPHHQQQHNHQLFDAHQFEMEVDHGYRSEWKSCIKMEEEDYLTSGDSVFGTTMLNGSVTPWPKSNNNNTTMIRGSGFGKTSASMLSAQRSTPSLPPLSVDVLKYSPSPCASGSSSVAALVTANTAPTPNSEFPMSTEDDDGDQFDTSFDAMMSSIDITTFLPGTFSAADDQLVEAEFEHDLSASIPSTLESETLIYERSESSLRYARPELVADSHQTQVPACSTYPLSPLSDLDALDKSSLFVIKQEWPVLA